MDGILVGLAPPYKQNATAQILNQQSKRGILGSVAVAHKCRSAMHAQAGAHDEDRVGGGGNDDGSGDAHGRRHADVTVPMDKATATMMLGVTSAIVKRG